MFVDFHGLQFELPSDWTDITDDLPVGSPPTLARPTGVGVIQFSIAKYHGGDEPNITIESLRQFLINFFFENNMNCQEIIEYNNEIISAGSTVCTDDEIVIARCFSNGKDITLVNYTSYDIENHAMVDDLTGVGIIMNSIKF